MSDYITIKDTVARFLRIHGASEALSSIPDFLTLAETRIYRKLRIPPMENITDLTTDLTDGFVTLPADYVESKSLIVSDTDPKRELEQRPYQEVAVTDRTGVPYYYAKKDNQLIFNPVPDKQYTIRLYYYRAFDDLSAASPNNYISNYAPDLLIYGALREAAPFIPNQELAIALSRVWSSRFDQALGEVEREANKAEFSGDPVQVRLG